MAKRKATPTPTIPNPVTVDSSPKAVRKITADLVSEGILDTMEMAVTNAECVQGGGTDDPDDADADAAFLARGAVVDRIAADIFARLQPAIEAAVSQALEAVQP